MFRELIKSKLFLIGGAAAAILLAVFWGREVWHKYQIDREERALQAEIDRLESQSRGLSDLIGYFRTPEYKERQAREVLGLQKPGEFVVALPSDVSDAEAEAAAQSAQGGGNPEKWWNYFFAKK